MVFLGTHRLTRHTLLYRSIHMAERNYSGPSPGSLQPVLTVSALDTTVVIDSLAAGTHYFAVTAIGDNGAESDFSSIENKMIP